MESPIQLDESGEWLAELEQLIAGCPKPTAIDIVGGIYCNLCHLTFSNKKEFDRHYTEQHNLSTSAIVYTCVVCHKEIAPYPNFRNHCYLVHVAKDRFKCEICQKHFSKQSILSSHVDSVHLFRCTSCQKVFKTKSELHTHKSIHKRDKDKPPYPCNQCSNPIENVDMCEMHIDEHCKILYPCPICNETTSSKIEIAKHVTTHFDEAHTGEIINTELSTDCSIDLLGGVLCSYCDELFKNRTDFDNHFMNEHSDKDIIYSCNICGKQYRKYQMFGNHCYFHVSKNRFECVECGKLFPRLSLLVLHTEAFHSTGSADNKPFSCVQCGHAFGSAPRLREHLRVVHTVNAFNCTEDGCSMTFDTPRDLILHQRTHRVSLDNYCRQCGLQFTTLSSCQAHLNVHRVTHYACPVCNREYKEKHLIIKHIPSHFESVLHICNICGKVYNARSRLVEHSKTHSDLRRHKCTFCGKGFMKPNQLEQHLNIHTGSRPHRCIVCSKTFASYPNCMKHLRKVHNIDRNNLKALMEDTKKASDVQTKNNIKKDTYNDVKSESGIESTSPEISMDTYIFGESDDSTMDSLDPAIIRNDWCNMNENALIDNSLQYTDMLPIAHTFESEIKSTPVASSVTQNAVFREYGPEFNVDDGIHLDEHYLPHIDPLLTIKPASLPTTCGFDSQLDTSTTAPETWEPLITKVYQSYDTDDVNRLSIINTNIF